MVVTLGKTVRVALAVAIVIAPFASVCRANKTDDELAAVKAQLAKAQAALVEANGRNADAVSKLATANGRNADSVSKLNTEVQKQAQVATGRDATASQERSSAIDASGQHAAEASDAAANQAEISKKAGDDATKAADVAKAQAATANNGNQSLIIIQAFTFLGLLVGFVYKGLERHWDLTEVHRKEEAAEKQRKADVQAAADVAEEHTAKLDKITVMADGGITAMMKTTVTALKAQLVQLKKLSPESIETIAMLEEQIHERDLEIATRERNVALAEKQASNKEKELKDSN